MCCSTCAILADDRFSGVESPRERRTNNDAPERVLQYALQCLFAVDVVAVRVAVCGAPRDKDIHDSET